MYCRNCANPIAENTLACTSCGVPPFKGKNYCYNCSNPTNTEAIICVKCGVGLKNRVGQLSTNVEAVLTRPSFWAELGVLVCFFLPWIDLSVVTVSGWEMKDLVRLIRMVSNENYKPSSLINLIYGLPVFSIVLLIGEFSESEYFAKRKKIFKLWIFLYPFLFLLLFMFNGSYNLKIERITDFVGYGLWITIAAGCYLLYDAYWNKNNSTEFVIVNTEVENVIEDVKPEKEEIIITSEQIESDAEYKKAYDETFNSTEEKSSNKTTYWIVGFVSLIVIALLIWKMFFDTPEKNIENSNVTETSTEMTSSNSDPYSDFIKTNPFIFYDGDETTVFQTNEFTSTNMPMLERIGNYYFGFSEGEWNLTFAQNKRTVLINYAIFTNGTFEKKIDKYDCHLTGNKISFGKYVGVFVEHKVNGKIEQGIILNGDPHYNSIYVRDSAQIGFKNSN